MTNVSPNFARFLAAEHEAHALRIERLPLNRPLHHYRNAFPSARNTFVLDDVRAAASASSGAPPTSRVSLLGSAPFLTFRATRLLERTAQGTLRARVTLADRSGTEHADVDDPFIVLRALLDRYAIPPSEATESALPLVAGAVGYVGYESGQMLERLPCLPRPSLGMPDMAFGFHDWILGRTDASEHAWLSVVGRGPTLEDARRSAGTILDAVRDALLSFERSGPIPAPSSRPVRSSRATHAHTPRASYMHRIATAKAHIEAGDAFEICLTHALDVPFSGDPWRLYDELRTQNPSPFSAFLDLPEGAVVSSSPERFVRLDTNGHVESRPIKGTRPRGQSPEDDTRIAEELRTSEKDRAENMMIVDLVRNDLGRICRYGTVTVPSLCAVERYATVHQLVSTIRGELEEPRDAVDVLTACFPPGSMTGAPKIEAMRILEHLEPIERGVYSGGLGYVDVRGSMDLSVVIRTAIVKDGVARVHVGGAIVSDSEPDAEYEETMHKARALLHALGGDLPDDRACAETTGRP